MLLHCSQRRRDNNSEVFLLVWSCQLGNNSTFLLLHATEARSKDLEESAAERKKSNRHFSPPHHHHRCFVRCFIVIGFSKSFLAQRTITTLSLSSLNTIIMSIELRSATGIRCALESIDDYSREPELSVCLGSLFLSKSLPDSIEAQLTLLLQQLGQQDALKSLEIRPVESENEKSTKYNPPSIYFPVNVVASAMFQARTCMKLGLENITLVGTEEDYERLAESLEGHPALASIVMQVHSLLQGTSYVILSSSLSKYYHYNLIFHFI